MTLPSSPRATLTRWLERLLLGSGGLSLGLALLGWGEGAVFQWALEWRLERALREGAGVAAPSRGGRRSDAPGAGDPIGRLEAPRLGLSAVVTEGVSHRTLRRAVGHIPGTALPWEAGNVALAGHRDTFFRPLRDVRVGDTFRLLTPRGSFAYVVRSLRVVGPERADLLRPAAGATLTLVTCYPFSMVGPAPWRLLVTAERVEAPL